MANKKEEEVKVTKKKNTNSNGKTTKKNTSTKTQTSKKSTNNTQKKNTAKKTASKSNTNKTSSVKKPTNKKSTTKKVIKKEEEIVLEKKQEFPDNFKEVDNNNISKQEKDEKEIVEEINNVNSIKVEDSKFKKVKSKALLPVGIIIAILGLAALIVSLVANRIIDREFMSDTAITIMLVISIIIEAFGAFIIINES